MGLPGRWRTITRKLRAWSVTWTIRETPQDFILARIYKIHTGAVVTLQKCVAGVWTVLVAETAVTYAAGSLLEIRRLKDTNDYQLWYAGAQVGADQTVDDARIVANKYHGLFDAGGANVCSVFFIDPVVWA